MQISSDYNQPAFGIRIYNENNALSEIVQCAKDKHILPLLDGILNNLYHVVGGDMVIIHGVDKTTGKVFSNFTIGNNTVHNPVKENTVPAAVSLQGLFDLLDKSNPNLMKLLGNKVSRHVRPEKIINRYSARE